LFRLFVLTKSLRSLLVVVFVREVHALAQEVSCVCLEFAAWGLRPFPSGQDSLGPNNPGHGLVRGVGAVLRSVGCLAAFYHDSLDINNPDQRELAAHRLIAKMPTLAALAHKYSIGQPFVYPQNHMGYGENFLNMMFSVPTEKYEVNPSNEESK
jgi:hypothetical protein